MKILFLDTASADPMLALCDDKRTIVLTHLPVRGDAEIIPLLEEALKKAQWTYDDLTHLACTIGPGGFTSLRIGVSAINALAYSLDLPSAGIHLSDIWRTRVHVVESGKWKVENYLWLHSTRKTQMFVKGFGNDGTVTPTELFALEDAVKLKGFYVGEIIPEHRALLKNCTMMPEEKILSLEKALPVLLSVQNYGKQILVPWYGREA